MMETVLDSAAIERLRRIGGGELVRRMLEAYIATAPARIIEMTQGATAGDTVRVERAAHTLKTSAGNVGAVRLQRTAESIEQSAGAGSIDASLIERVAVECADSVAAVQRLLEEQH